MSSTHERWRWVHRGSLMTLAALVGWNTHEGDVSKTLTKVFAGTTHGGLTLVSLGLHLLLFLGAAIISHADLTDRLPGAIYPELLRRGSTGTWLVRRAASATGYVASAVLAAVVGAVIGSWAFAVAHYGESPNWPQAMPLLLFVMMAGTAQGFFYWLLMLAGTWTTGRIQVGIPVTGVVCLGLLPYVRLDVSPFGAASTGGSFVSWTQIPTTLAVLTGWSALVAIGFVLASRHRDIEFH